MANRCTTQMGVADRARLQAVNRLDVLSAVVQTCQPGNEAGGQVFVLALPPQTMMLSAGASRLTQIFSSGGTRNAPGDRPAGR